MVIHAVVMQESRYVESYELALRPWEHYIPFDSDIGNIVERADLLLRNATLQEYILQNGRAAILRVLSLDSILCSWSQLLRNYATATSFEVALNPAAQRSKPFSRLLHASSGKKVCSELNPATVLGL